MQNSEKMDEGFDMAVKGRIYNHTAEHFQVVLYASEAALCIFFLTACVYKP